MGVGDLQTREKMVAREKNGKERKMNKGNAEISFLHKAKMVNFIFSINCVT